jgi:hypothetical protein
MAAATEEVIVLRAVSVTPLATILAVMVRITEGIVVAVTEIFAVVKLIIVNSKNVSLNTKLELLCLNIEVDIL